MLQGVIYPSAGKARGAGLTSWIFYLCKNARATCTSCFKTNCRCECESERRRRRRRARPAIRPALLITASSHAGFFRRSASGRAKRESEWKDWAAHFLWQILFNSLLAILKRVLLCRIQRRISINIRKVSFLFLLVSQQDTVKIYFYLLIFVYSVHFVKLLSLKSSQIMWDLGSGKC